MRRLARLFVHAMLALALLAGALGALLWSYAPSADPEPEPACA